MIQQVSFTNFKSLRRVDVELGRFMVIVGPNGSGKTSILDGLYYLAQATQKPLRYILSDAFAPPNLKSRDSAGPMKLSLSGRFRGVGARVEIVITCEDDANATWNAMVTRRWGEAVEDTRETKDGARQALKPVVRRPKPSAARPPLASSPPSPRPQPPPPSVLRVHQRPELAELARELGSAQKLRLDIETLAAPSYSQEETPHLKVDGAGLASVLADAAGRTPEAFQAIQEAAIRIIPTLERIRTRRARIVKLEKQEIRVNDEPIQHTTSRIYWGQQLVLDFKGAPDVSAPLASEGTLLVIGLLTALHMEPRPRLLLLDDIDKTLHPRAQGELVAQLRKVLEMDPELQIIATSHSPYLLDHFDAQDVLLTALRPDGSTACARLTDHPDFDRWKDTTRPGELWSFLGEDWVAQRAGASQERE